MKASYLQRSVLLPLALPVLLLPGVSGLSQQDNPPEPRPTLKKEAPQQQRPTLGKDEDAPTSSGPQTSTTANPRRLVSISSIFVESIDNSLSEELMDGLSRIGRFHIVASKKDADAVLRGTCFDARRLRRLHSEVYLSDRASGKSIWQDIVRRPYNPPPLRQAVSDTAAIILAHLKQSVEEAQSK